MTHKESMNPMMVQSYFDGELSSDTLEAISQEDLQASQTYQALAELRDVVRIESECALSDIDGQALFHSICRQIQAESPCLPQRPHVNAPKRRTSKQFFQRWMPAFIGAALFLLSIPGLVHWIVSDDNSKDNAVQPQTVVVIDRNGDIQQPQIVAYPNQKQTPTVALPSPAVDSDQLTVEEMDFALRHLIKRIESLENEKHQQNQVIETIPLQDVNIL